MLDIALSLWQNIVIMTDTPIQSYSTTANTAAMQQGTAANLAVENIAEPRDVLGILCFEVNALANHLRKTNALLHRPDGLPAGGRSLLQILNSDGPKTVPELARLSLTSRQNIQVLVNRLKADGWVEIAGNPAHKRSGFVSLTRRAKAWLAIASKPEDELWQKLASRFSAVEIAAATVLLRKLRADLDPPEQPTGPIHLDSHARRRMKKNPVVTDQAVPAQPVPEPVEPSAEPDQPEEFPINLL